MVLTLFSSSSASWLFWEAIVSLLASFGGLIVLRGLWLEGYKEKEEFKTVDEFRFFKTREGKGRKWVFWGVLFEVVLAFGMTFKDGYEYNELKKEIIRNDPLNQPIKSMSAEVSLQINGTNFDRYMLTDRDTDQSLA